MEATQTSIDEALARLGALTGGAPFGLELSPSDAALDEVVEAIARERGDLEGQLFVTVAAYLQQLADNLGSLPPPTTTQLALATSERVVRFAIDPEGGQHTPISKLRDGRLELLFRPDALRVGQYGWAWIGNDLPEVLAELFPRKLEPTAEQLASTERHLAALGEFVGDGKPWTYELAMEAEAMDAAITAEADYMKGCLYQTIDELLGYINVCVRRSTPPEIVAATSASRTLVFELVDSLDDLPRRYLGSFQAVIKNDKLYFRGPACDFKTNGAGASRIGEDLEHAVNAMRGQTGPTERELQLAASLAAIAATSTTPEPGSRPCTMCKGTKLNACNACHAKGCSVCKGTGRSRSKCSSCDGLGTK